MVYDLVAKEDATLSLFNDHSMKSLALPIVADEEVPLLDPALAAPTAAVTSHEAPGLARWI